MPELVYKPMGYAGYLPFGITAWVLFIWAARGFRIR